MRIMAIDYGDARTGIAISDPTGQLTGTAFVVASRNRDRVVSQVAEFVREYGVSEVILGLPRNMDGSLGARAELCQQLAPLLEEATSLPVQLWDERLTTVDAHRILSDTGNFGKKRKAKVDAVAASLILEGYLRCRQIKEGNS